MKVKVPAKTIEVCDVCHREARYFDACLFCGKKYCITCRGIIYGCIHEIDVCRDCDKNEVVLMVAKKFVPRIRKVLLARDDAIREAAQQKMHPTKNGRGKSDKVSTPAVFGG